MRPLLSAALFALAATAAAAPPTLDIPAEVRPVNGYVRFAPKTDGVSVTYVALDGVYPFPSDELKDARRFILPAAGLKDGRYRFVAVAAGKGGEQSQAEFSVLVGKEPAPPPIPPTPDPTPVPPVPPTPPTAFKVMLVYESMATHTAAQKAVLEGRVVEEYLTAKCDGGKAGWQRRDKDSDPAADTTPADMVRVLDKYREGK
jgi:hypothetical protein